MVVPISSFPPSLRNKVPGMVFMFLEQRYLPFLIGLVLSVLSFHGPLLGRVDHNGIRYLLGPLLCPMVCTIYLIVRPFNPYRGFAARWAGMIYVDKPGSAEERLVELFQSRIARRSILQIAISISGLMFLLMVTLAWLERGSLSWSLLSAWSVPGLLGGCIGSFVVLSSEHIAWGLKTWASHESPQR